MVGHEPWASVWTLPTKWDSQLATFPLLSFEQDRSQLDGIKIAIDQFQKAAGIFKYLAENFSHAPSMDMSTPVLDMLHYLMLVSIGDSSKNSSDWIEIFWGKFGRV